MKSVALIELTARPEELLDGLAKGETFAVTETGRKIATLLPVHPLETLVGEGNAYDAIADLVGSMEGPP